MNIVLKESEYVEELLRDHQLGPKPTETLVRVARYYSTIDKMKKADVRAALEEFMLRCDPTINLVKWQDTLDRIIKGASKYPMVDIESIPITEKEIALCDGLSKDTKRRDLSMYKSFSDKPMRRLLFTLICLAKDSDTVNSRNGGWVNRTDKEIFKLANVVTPIKRQSLMLNDLREMGYIKFSRKVDNVNINVQCLDHGGTVALEIRDFRNLGYQYMRHCGEAYIECEQCGLVIKQRNNSQKYCPDCAIEVNRQRSIDRRKVESF